MQISLMLYLNVKSQDDMIIAKLCIYSLSKITWAGSMGIISARNSDTPEIKNKKGG
jgi:hypothetical protein